MSRYTKFTDCRKHMAVDVRFFFKPAFLQICDSHLSNSLFLWNSRNEAVNDSGSLQLHIIIIMTAFIFDKWNSLARNSISIYKRF